MVLFFPSPFADRPCPKEGFYRYANSCQLHYECYFDEQCGSLVASRLYSCPHCLQFNVKKQRCDFPLNVPECTYHEEDEDILEGHTVTVPLEECTTPGIFKDPGNPKRYFNCTHIYDDRIYLTIEQCPKGKVYNDFSKTCVQTNDTIKIFRRVLEGGNYKIGSYAFDKYSCWRFFFFAPNTIVELHCPQGFIFSGKVCEDINTSTFCNWEELKKYLYNNRN